MKHSGFHRTIVALTMMLIGWLPTLAYSFEVDGIHYNRTEGREVEVISKGHYENGYVGSIIIPSSVNYKGRTYDVASIGYGAFEYCTSLTSVVIGNGVTSIGSRAFFWCTSLTSVVIGNGVTSIGNNAFHECTRLTNVVIGNSVTSIGSSAFFYCESLTSIEIPNSVTSIGYGAFTHCSSLTSVVIGNSVKNIGDCAFYYCSSLTSIEIPNSVTSIGGGAFSDCSSLTSIEIPNSVTSIGDSAFAYCSSLTDVVIGNSVTSIGEGAFSDCSSLTSIVVDSGNTEYDSRNGCNAIIETASNTLIAGCQNTIILNSVTSIGDRAFSGCTSLTSIEIPNSVTSIGEWAFSDCSSLTSIEIPNSVTRIGEWAFSDCSSLTSIEIPNSVTSIGDEAFWGCSNLTSIEIPNSITSIGEGAFEYCSSLTSIEIPNSVTSIGDRAFAYCSSLTDVVIGNSVTSIGEYAFWRCSNLTSIQIPNSVTSIGDDAFNSCTGLTSVIIGNSVTSIGDDAFANCSRLTEITCWATTPPTIYSNTFSNYSADLYVPVGCKSAYQSANYWKNFNIKEIPIILSTSIALNQTTATLKATETLTLVATILPENATDKSVTWKSSNEAVATVDANGKVTAVAVGEATITATTTDGSNLSASCKVTVTSTLATSITLDYTEYEIAEKSDFQLTATILPESTTNKGVVWSSSDMWIASVDENGLVRAYSIGEAVITATTIDGSNLSASCKVTVVSSIAQSITLDKTEVSLEVTETAALVAIVLPKLASNKSVEWSSSNEAIAVVDENGVVTAISIGEAVITATTVDGSNLSASCKVTVIPTLAGSIELDKTQVSNEEKTYIQLTATILPEHTTNKEVAWSSSKKVIATVDDTGLVFVKSVGEVVITATTTDGSNLSASCYINVYSSDIDGIEGDDLIVATIGDNIVVKNAQLGSNVRVYAADGSIIASEIATDGDVVIEAPIKGVYIVSVNGKTFKVMVK